MLNTIDTPAAAQPGTRKNAAVEVKLTNRGRQLLALIRRNGEAVERHNSMLCNDPRFEEAERQSNAIFREVSAAVDAILTAPKANLGDLAVACECVFLPGASSDQHEQVHTRLMEALLGTIGLTRSQCDFSTWMEAGESGGSEEAAPWGSPGASAPDPSCRPCWPRRSPTAAPPRRPRRRSQGRRADPRVRAALAGHDPAIPTRDLPGALGVRRGRFAC